MRYRKDKWNFDFAEKNGREIKYPFFENGILFLNSKTTIQKLDEPQIDNGDLQEPSEEEIKLFRIYERLNRI